MQTIIKSSKHKKWRWILAAFGLIIFIYVIFFISQVWRIRQQILVGNYNWQDYGQEISGKGGANISDKLYYFSTATDPAIGAPKPKITIIEFADFQCPFCKKAFPIIRTVVNEYQDQVRLIYKNFPLTDIHSMAQLSAQGGYCAEQQNLFWPYHDKVFQNQEQLSRPLLIKISQQIGLEQVAFINCLDSLAAQEKVNADLLAGIDAGVRGTPTWFINGQRLAGVIPADILRRIIDTLIKNK